MILSYNNQLFSSFQRAKAVLIFITIFLACSGCKKFADVPPPNNQLVSATVFNTDNSVKAALAGMYVRMYIENGGTFQLDISTLAENSADESKAFAADLNYDPFYNNTIDPNNTSVYYLWSGCYNLIYQANAIIAGVNANAGQLSTAVKKQAEGEAKFIRAFCYFYLTNYFGDVPLLITTNAVENSRASRTSSDQVYSQIISDLKDAQGILVEDFSTSATQSRIRPNKYAAAAFLSRVYLYRKQWAEAEAQASLVINKSTQYRLNSTADIPKIFQLNNPEVIFQMNGATSGSSTVYSGFTYYGSTYMRSIASNRPYMVLGTSLIQSFENGDQRYTNWVGSLAISGKTYYYPLKYKLFTTNNTPTGEGFVYLRLAEQYLIRAEARAQQSNLTGAAADINIIRNRAGLGNTSANTQNTIIDAVMKERRVELFCELGHRWLDLKRTGTADLVLSPLKPNWKASAKLYPIPTNDLLNNTNLIQNAGY